MSTYAIGDIQGCYAQLARMLERVAFDPSCDRLWLVGDLVNRGPDSLRVLRLLRELEGAADVVLGNHDLYLLMVAAGYKRRGSDDTLYQVLEAPDRDELLDWLARLPLLQLDGEHVLVHAGLLPGWTVTQAKALSDEVGAALAGPRARSFLLDLAGNQPERWWDGLKGWDRLRVIVNALHPAAFLQGRRAHGPARQGAALAGAARDDAVVPRARAAQPDAYRRLRALVGAGLPSRAGADRARFGLRVGRQADRAEDRGRCGVPGAGLISPARRPRAQAGSRCCA